jgi:hypothetical protein
MSELYAMVLVVGFVSGVDHQLNENWYVVDGKMTLSDCESARPKQSPAYAPNGSTVAQAVFRCVPMSELEPKLKGGKPPNRDSPFAGF